MGEEKKIMALSSFYTRSFGPASRVHIRTTRRIGLLSHFRLVGNFVCLALATKPTKLKSKRKIAALAEVDEEEDEEVEEG
jgi:hypothetical protein